MRSGDPHLVGLVGTLRRVPDRAYPPVRMLDAFRCRAPPVEKFRVGPGDPPRLVR